MISYPQALEIIGSAVAPLATEERNLEELADCAAGSPITSRLDVPGFANAAMDGFAVRAADTSGAHSTQPLKLPVTGIVAAGDSQPATTRSGTAVEIMTGAAMPLGCDAVIPMEHVTIESGPDGSPQSIRLTAPAEAGQNVRRAGEDFQAGEPILDVGRDIEPHVLMGLAATGTDRIEVRPPPRISVITTGSELTSSGIPARSGLIRDANGPYLAAAVHQLGARLACQATAADDSRSLQARMGSCAGQSDVILTTGGVSAGRFDMVPDAVAGIGGEILFHKVAIRPGKPLLFARLPQDKLLFGLPGNPIAVAVGLRFFVVPALRGLQGLPAEKWHTGRSRGRIRKREHQRFFGKARAQVTESGHLDVQLLPGQESFKIGPLMAANCWAIVPEGRDSVAPGELIQVAPLYPTSFLQPCGT